MTGRIAQYFERCPLRFHGFRRMQKDRQFARHPEQKWSHQHETPRSSARQHRRQRGFKMFSPEPDSALLFEFAECRMQQVRIFRVAAPARKRPVSRPGVIGPLRAPDEQNGLLRFDRMQDRHRCFRLSHLFYDPSALPLSSYHVAEGVAVGTTLMRVAGETILVVEDSAVSLKLTAALLRSEGYKVHIASTAEQALSTLRTLRPHLMLADLQLPGMSGLELTRRVKQDENLREMLVVALTGHAPEGEEQIAKDAGCDGFLVKSADTHALITRVRSYLDRGESTPAPAAGATLTAQPISQPASFALPESEMEDLRRSFLADAAVQVRHMLADLGTQLDAPALRRIVHPWTGTAGMLGFARISELSREVETLLQAPSPNVAGLRAALTNLARAISDPGVAAMDAALPDFIVEELTGKRVALVGFGEVEADRLCAALDRVGAKPRLLEASDSPDSPLIRECNVIMMHVRRETLGSVWLDPQHLTPHHAPLVFIGGRDLLLSLDPSVQSRAREFLIDGWQPEEALMRLSFALSRTVRCIQSVPMAEPAPAMAAPEIVIADDDITVRTLVRAVLENEGMQCRLESNGPEALERIRNRPPQAAVLDVNMPGMDGFEVLAAIRAEGLPVHVILLTARQQQNDVVRGFSLGADDYIIKPVRPMELVARLKRLLA